MKIMVLVAMLVVVVDGWYSISGGSCGWWLSCISSGIIEVQRFLL